MRKDAQSVRLRALRDARQRYIKILGAMRGSNAATTNRNICVTCHASGTISNDRWLTQIWRPRAWYRCNVPAHDLNGAYPEKSRRASWC
jgi:hypothetical protein